MFVAENTIDANLIPDAAPVAPAHTLGHKVPTDVDNIVDALLSAGIPTAPPVKVPMASVMPDGEVRVVPDRFNLIDSTGRVVGENVSPRYQPIGFGEQLSVLDKLTGLHTGDFKLDRVVSFDGRTIFFSISLDGLAYDVAGMDDKVVPHIWFYGSHDSSTSTGAVCSTSQPFCSNQLAMTKRMAKSLGLPHFNIRHTRSAHAKLQLASEMLLNCEKIVMTQKAIMQQLAGDRFTTADFSKFVDALMPLPTEPLEGEPTRGYTLALNRREKLFDLYASGRHAIGTEGTKWRALNAVTEYTTHHMATRGGNPAEKRFLSTLNGPAAKLNDHAMRLLTA
jgi:phage/plasmid-like protein (TIGR03299 family)